MSDQSGGFQGQSTGTESPDGQGSEQQSEYSLASEFLQGIPEEKRSDLEPFVKQWDAGVTRRFQELHGQYQPYKELGDIETLQTATNLLGMLNENPQELYRLLHEEYGQAPQQQQNQQQQQVPGAETLQGFNQDAFQEYFKPFQEKIDTQEQALRTIAGLLLENREKDQQFQEDAALDQYLGLLKTEYGEFDEDYVLTKMAAGVDGPSAIKAFKSLTQGQVNAAMQANGEAPRLLSGNGTVPAESQSVADLSSRETKDLVVNILKKAHAQT